VAKYLNYNFFFVDFLGLKRTNSEPSYIANKIGIKPDKNISSSYGSLTHNSVVRCAGASADTYSTASSTSSMSSSPFHSDSPLGTPNFVEGSSDHLHNDNFSFFPGTLSLCLHLK